MSDKRLIDRWDARELVHARIGSTHLGWTKVDDVHIDNSRWTEIRMCVVSGELGALYAFDYERGLTECQDGEDMFGDEQDILLSRVKAVPVSKVEYHFVEDDE